MSGRTKPCERCGKIIRRRSTSDNMADFRRRRFCGRDCWESARTKKCSGRNPGNTAAVTRWKIKNRHKVRAHKAVRSALTTGRLRQGACEVCGSNTVQAHHDDYTRPLKVRWLCRKHHEDAHHKQVTQ